VIRKSTEQEAIPVLLRQLCTKMDELIALQTPSS
jgi:hypothetical protein